VSKAEFFPGGMQPADLAGDAWNTAIAHLPLAHVLQSWQWGEIKRDVGWQALPQVWRDARGEIQAAALILQRTVRLMGVLPLTVLYIPRGPLLDWSDIRLSQRVLDDLQTFARRRHAIFLKIDPALPVGRGVPGSENAEEDRVGLHWLEDIQDRGWRFSSDQIQFRNTVMIDLAGCEEDWLVRMKQKSRYNIRLAERKGVQIRRGTLDDLGLLYHMYAETSVRDGFVIRNEKYYQTVWKSFMQAGMAEPLIAEVEGQPVAAVFLFSFGNIAWYLYGMSRDLHREKMPNSLLQWQAMRWAAARGCVVYDLWGAPDEFNESDSMWGVFRFKEGLGGEVVRTVGAWDYTFQPLMYTLYTRLLPRWLDILRRRGKKQTRQEVAL